ncbi:MucR family transcriptional regulator [Methylobacterium sp. NEAU 140]|uniref:MucR family transcriptional regulator n=1 Tax=Methylobacterium sp. NEAU 140 TaxID=3064945 RepID=UPI0027332028|nr:MucR family transcriptional regulator [Methylobacterium sp. NEAU 140]MDP4025502.1 MucR family transcriptional regulator [Methylobacterium sp. NEAU 140]
MDEVANEKRQGLVDATVDLVAAYVSKNHVRPGELAALIATVHAGLASLGSGTAPETAAVERPTPAQIRKSITHDALISFIDGKPYKTLKRHLTSHGLTVRQYCERYGLPADYPTTAAGYSEARSALARDLGLGRPRVAADEAGESAAEDSAEPVADTAPEAAPEEAAADAAQPAPRRPRKAKPKAVEAE